MANAAITKAPPGAPLASDDSSSPPCSAAHGQATQASPVAALRHGRRPRAARANGTTAPRCNQPGCRPVDQPPEAEHEQRQVQQRPQRPQGRRRLTPVAERRDAARGQRAAGHVAEQPAEVKAGGVAAATTGQRGTRRAAHHRAMRRRGDAEREPREDQGCVHQPACARQRPRISRRLLLSRSDITERQSASGCRTGLSSQRVTTLAAAITPQKIRNVTE